MHNILNVDIKDFYFNGRYLSSFGGYVGSSSGLSELTALPAREYVTDRAVGQDGVSVFDSYLEPRSFVIPVVFHDLSAVTVREISTWLNTKTPTQFYWKNDDLKINVMVDGDSMSTFRLIAEKTGFVEIKFIAHDPYFYELDEIVFSGTFTFIPYIGSFASIDINNYGSEVSYPIIDLNASGNIVIEIKDYLGNVVQRMAVNNAISDLYIDNKNRIITHNNGQSAYTLLLGNNFINIPVGEYTIEIVAMNGTTYSVYPKLRWL